jgi:hypothetical protein
MTTAQHIKELKRLVAAYGLRPRDFFLTAPRVRGRARERTRRRIAQQLFGLGLSAHDLADVAKISGTSKLPAGTAGTASRTNESAPE